MDRLLLVLACAALVAAVLLPGSALVFVYAIVVLMLSTIRLTELMNDDDAR